MRSKAGVHASTTASSHACMKQRKREDGCIEFDRITGALTAVASRFAVVSE
jgi:hypothetical protein